MSVICANRPETGLGESSTLAVDTDTGEILASDLSSRRTPDCARVGALLEQIDDPLASVSADGAYDAAVVYEAAQEWGEERAVRVLHSRSHAAGLSESCVTSCRAGISSPS